MTDAQEQTKDIPPEETPQPSAESTESPQSETGVVPDVEIPVQMQPGELEAKLSVVQEREKNSQEKYLRLHAEFENYRRRTAREQMELIETANAKLLEKLSEVADNFERALGSPLELPDGRAVADLQGVQLIQQQFWKILSESGLEALDPIGQEFDPTTQEALLKQPSQDIPENHVLAVFQKGYRVKHKVIKPAKVIVSAGAPA